MRETVAAFERRTGLRYEPPDALESQGGRPLRRHEACPTLFRHPGAEALRAFLDGTLRRLAPVGRASVWLASDPGARAAQPRGAKRFGSIAVLEPLRLSPGALQPHGLYLGANPPLRGLPGLVWIPPSMLAARIPWDRLRTPEDVIDRAGPGYERERDEALRRIARYLEDA